jgi:predicted phage tail protein
MVGIGQSIPTRCCGIRSDCDMLMQVKLLGDLGQKFGRHYEFVADSPREVISALSNQLAGFKQYLCEAHEKNVAFKLVDDDPDGMSYENAVMPCKRLIIAPMVMGGGSAGKILLGVGLIALSFVSFGAGAFAGVGGLSAAAAGGTAIPAFTAAGSMVLFKLGATLLFTGIAELLTPTPKDGGREESFLFDQAAETSVQGTPVPLIYGRYLATSPALISSSVTTYQVPV